jgi:hypothetical protein
VHPCKTVGVVLRWFESITRHHSKTASELRKRNSEAVADFAERGYGVADRWIGRPEAPERL